MPEDERPDCNYSLEWDLGSYRFSAEFMPDGTIYVHTLNLDTGLAEDGEYDLREWIDRVKRG